MNNTKNIYNKVKKATVAVAAINKEEAKEPFTIIGSGFCIDSEGIIITCRHVIEAMMAKKVSQQLEKKSSKKSDSKIQIKQRDGSSFDNNLVNSVKHFPFS